jgi:hypothetical protein
MNKKARVIAFYLPQFHPIPENDKWWGKGFTEWTNVGKAKPLFKGHYQPRVPADLGYYDLRMPEVREAQAEMARNAGIEGFMYWHYWFGNGKTLLERPFQEVLKSGKPDFPFCLGWANHSWENKTWHSAQQYKESIMLMEQLYPGVQDYKDHFYYVLNAFQDRRYIKIDGKPIFFIYNAIRTELKDFMAVWQELARENGLNGIYFIGQIKRKEQHDTVFNSGFNGMCRDGFLDTIDKINFRYFNSTLIRLKEKFKYLPLSKFEYSDFIEKFNLPEFDRKENVFPIILPNYDHSPRSKRKGFILINSTPDLFRIHVRKTLEYIKDKQPDHKIIFLRSWNEWAEGNYIEPDLVFKHGYLNALKEELG